MSNPTFGYPAPPSNLAGDSFAIVVTRDWNGTGQTAFDVFAGPESTWGKADFVNAVLDGLASFVKTGGISPEVN